MLSCIVGAGMAGIQILTYLLDNTSDQILIFDRKPFAGRGLPFLQDDRSLLLNQPIDQMSLIGDEEHYRRWLDEKRPGEAGERFSTRWTYGDYSQSIFDDLLSSPRVTWIERWVEDIEIDGDGFKVTDDHDDSYMADTVHLCTGMLPPKDPWDLLGFPNYIYHPYPVFQRKNMFLDAEMIGLIGTGLTTVDLALFLESIGYQGKILFIGDSGMFPTVRGPHVDIQTDAYAAALADPDVTLRKLIAAYCDDAHRNGVDTSRLLGRKQDPVSAIHLQLDNLREFAVLQQLTGVDLDTRSLAWNRLSLQEQLIFNRKFRSVFKVLQSPMPEQSARTILSILESGRGEVITDVDQISARPDGQFLVRAGDDEYEPDILVNSTGSRTELTDLTPAELSEHHSGDWSVGKSGWGRLLLKLLDRKILQADPVGGVSIEYPEFAAVSQRYGVLHNLKVYGDAVSGLHFGNNAVSLVAGPQRRGTNHA